MRHFATSDAKGELMSTKVILTQASAVTSFPLFDSDGIQTRRFLDILAGNEGVTFQTFSDRDELKIKRPSRKDFDPNAHIRHGTLAQHREVLECLNAKGAGVYFMVNAGDGKGRTAKNVTRVRSLFIDTDGAPYPADLPLQPHLVTQSSPGKYHLYWLVDGLELDAFSTLQQALAEHYGTDPAVHDLPRVMRLPGFYHCKGEPVMVQLLEAHNHPPYTPANIFKAWPFLAERLERERALEVKREREHAEIAKRAAERRAVPLSNPHERTQAQRLLQAHHDTVAGAGAGTRHGTLLKAAHTLGGYVAGGYLEFCEAEDVLRAAAEVCGLPDAEAEDVIRWGLDKGAEKPLELSERTAPQIASIGGKSAFDEHGASSNKSPWVTQKTDLMNATSTQIGDSWVKAKSPWGKSWQ